jgi:hypothetical protein
MKRMIRSSEMDGLAPSKSKIKKTATGPPKPFIPAPVTGDQTGMGRAKPKKRLAP